MVYITYDVYGNIPLRSVGSTDQFSGKSLEQIVEECVDWLQEAASHCEEEREEGREGERVRLQLSYHPFYHQLCQGKLVHVDATQVGILDV